MYMGAFYGNGGDFTKAAIYIGVIDLTLLVVFIGAQLYKGTSGSFAQSIVIERVLLALCPLVFIWAMLPYNHFWNVYEHREKIESTFNNAISGVKEMFSEYEKYSTERIDNLNSKLNQAIASGDGTVTNETKGIYIDALKLQLQSEDGGGLRPIAEAWIDKVNNNATVWNAFLVGNIGEISKALAKWEKNLEDNSKDKLSVEVRNGGKVQEFKVSGATYQQSKTDLQNLQNIYADASGVNWITIVTGIVLFGMLLLPYLVQGRHTRAQGYVSVLSNKPRNNGRKRNNKKDPPSDFESSRPANQDMFGQTF